jgi:cell division protein FtsL
MEEKETITDVDEVIATVKKFNWKKMFQYQWMVEQLPFILFLVLLAIIYIANGHYADKVIRNTGKARAELKQLQYEYKVLKADVMYRSKESELVKAVEPLGLKRTEQPAVVLVDSVVRSSASD